MKVSYNWLQSYFKEPLPSPAELGALLTMYAFEVETIEPQGNDTVMDVKVLANRAHDCLCHRGVARELGVILNRTLIKDSLLGDAPSPGPSSKIFSVQVDTDKVYHFSTALVRNVHVAPSPEWLVEALAALGQKSINNVVDITNYVMFNLGQPMHAFDFDKLTLNADKGSFIVRESASGETTVTLDGAERAIPNGSVVITDGETEGKKILGIAGVKGGKVSEISPDTKHIVLEAAVFDGPTIRRTSQALRLRTDASARFEHGIAPQLPSYALPAALELIKELASGPDTTVEGFAGVYPTTAKAFEINISTQNVNKLLGTSLTDSDLEGVLARFQYAYTKKADIYCVSIPFERLDLRLEEDLIEEIGRIYGLDNVPSTQPALSLPTPPVNKNFYYIEKIRRILTANGFSEVSTYALVNKGEVELQNPLASGKKFLRSNLYAGLSAALNLNTHNGPLLGLSHIRLFEIGTVFSVTGEEIHLGLIAGGEKARASDKEKILQNVQQELNTQLGVTLAGNYFENPKMWEVNLSEIVESLPQPNHYDLHEINSSKSYCAPSIYPFVLRDVAIFVPAGVSVQSVQEVIQNQAGPSLVQMFLFDTFEKDGKVSLAFRLVFQSHEKTLSDEEVNVVMNTITTTLNNQSGWQVR